MRLLAFAFFAFSCFIAGAADRYWVGGGSSAAWTATGPTNWGTASNTQDNASVPGAGDNAIFDGVGTGASNCTISAASTCNSMNTTGYTNTISQTSAGLTASDGITVGSGTIWTQSGTAASNTISCTTFTLSNGNSTVFTQTGPLTATGAVTLGSGQGAGQVITWTQSGTSATVSCAGFSSTSHATGTCALTQTAAMTNSASLTFTSNLTYTLSGLGAGTTMTFNAASGSQTITTAGKTVGSWVFNGANPTWTLQDNVTQGSNSQSFTFTDGNLDLNGKTISAGIFSSNNSNTRSMTFNGGTINVNGNGGNVWALQTVANLTWTQDTGIVNCTSGTGSATSFQGGGLTTYGTVNITGSGIQSMAGANTFTNLTRTGTAAKTDEWEFQANQTVTGTLTINGNSSLNRMLVRSNSKGTARTLTAATVSVTNSDFQDITGAGAGSWNLSAISGLSGDALGNSGITFTSPQTNYWVGGTGNWDASGEWASTSGGAGGSGRVPLPQDGARFDANSFSAGGQTVTGNMPRVCKDLDWTGATNSPTLSLTVARTLYGSLTRISTMTITTPQGINFEGRGSHTITSAGTSFANNVTINAPGGTYTLADAFSHTTTGAFTITQGTFNDGGFSTASRNFSSSNSNTRAITLTGTFTNTGVSACHTLSTVTGLTLTASASTLIFTDTTTAKTLAGGAGLVWGNLQTAANDAGGLLISGAMTFGNVTLGAGGAGVVNFNSATTFGSLSVGAPKSIRFKNGATNTCNGFINMRGSAGNVITIDTDVPTAAGTITSSFYMHQFNYISVRDITVSGTAKWYAGWNSTNTSNNTGWQTVAGGTDFNSAGGFFGAGF